MPGVIEEQFIVRGQPGEEPGTTTHVGLPVGAALREYAGVQSFGYLTVPRPNGTSAYLASRSFEEPESPSFEGGLLALFSYNEGSTRFARPPFAGDANDVNGEDGIATVTGEPMVVGVHDGAVVTVGASASTTSTEAGSAVRFTANVEGGLPGEGFSFEWRFGDGATASGESAVHSFTGSGTYEVRVVAAGTDESGGESGPVNIVVGNPPVAGQPSAAPAPDPNYPKPQKKTPGPAPKDPHAAGHDAGGGDRGARPNARGGSAGDAPAAGATPTASPAAAAPSPESPPSDAIPPTAPEPAAKAPSQPDPAPEQKNTPQAPAARSARQGELVEGRLVAADLGSTEAVEAASGASPQVGSGSASVAAGEGGFGVPVVAFTVVILLGAGALFEWRRRPPIR
ncbi:MAG: PKD domain-containing protein [Actinobacteria bacterium]|nr:PKD domain-containing protein [Actinomycetota bacterium]